MSLRSALGISILTIDVFGSTWGLGDVDVPTWFVEKSRLSGARANVQNAVDAAPAAFASLTRRLGGIVKVRVKLMNLRIATWNSATISVFQSSILRISQLDNTNHGYNQRLGLFFCRLVAASHALTPRARRHIYRILHIAPFNPSTTLCRRPSPLNHNSSRRHLVNFVTQDPSLRQRRCIFPPTQSERAPARWKGRFRIPTSRGRWPHVLTQKPQSQSRSNKR